METVFSSAFLLYVIDAISPGFVPDQTWLATAHGIFDVMIARGSPAAPLRKRELQRLEHAMESYLRAESTEINSSILSHEEAGLEQSVEQGMGREDERFMGDSLSWDLFGDAGGLIMSPGRSYTWQERFRSKISKLDRNEQQRMESNAEDLCNTTKSSCTECEEE
jgi:hypothetical protein